MEGLAYPKGLRGHGEELKGLWLECCLWPPLVWRGEGRRTVGHVCEIRGRWEACKGF